MFNKKCGLLLLTLLLLLSVGSVCAADNTVAVNINATGNTTNLDHNVSTINVNNSLTIDKSNDINLYDFHSFPTKRLKSLYNICDWSTFDYNVDNFLTLDKELLTSYHISPVW